MTRLKVSSPNQRRYKNIQIIKQMILKGLTYQEIWKKVSIYFNSNTFNKYYDIAMMLIEADKVNEKYPPKYDTYEKIEKKAKK